MFVILFCITTKVIIIDGKIPLIEKFCILYCTRIISTGRIQNLIAPKKDNCFKLLNRWFKIPEFQYSYTVKQR